MRLVLPKPTAAATVTVVAIVVVTVVTAVAVHGFVLALVATAAAVATAVEAAAASTLLALGVGELAVGATRTAAVEELAAFLRRQAKGGKRQTQRRVRAVRCRGKRPFAHSGCTYIHVYAQRSSCSPNAEPNAT